MPRTIRWLLPALPLAAAWAQSEPGSGVISGRVVDARTGSPLSKAIVGLSSSSGRGRLNAATDTEGRFEFTALPAGWFHLSVDRAGFLPRPRAGRIELTSAKATVKGLELTLRPEGRLSGRVVDADGEPAAGVRIILLRQVFDFGLPGWDALTPLTMTNDEGEYRFAGLQPGRYLVRAVDARPAIQTRFGAPPVPWRPVVYHPGVTARAQAMPVEVTSGREASGTGIRLVRPVSQQQVRVKGTVTGLSTPGNHVTAIQFQDLDEMAVAASTLTAPGQPGFEVLLFPGRYRVWAAEHSTGRHSLAATIVAAGDSMALTLDLQRNERLAGRLVVPQRTAVKLDRIQMTLQSEAPEGRLVMASTARTDEQGRFAWSAMPPGRYVILPPGRLPDGFYESEIRLNGAPVSWEGFEWRLSGELEVILAPGAGSITAMILGTDGKPAAGGIAVVEARESGRRPDSGVAGETGEVRLTNLRPGKYRIFAMEADESGSIDDPAFRKRHADRAVDVEVEPGGTAVAVVKSIPLDQ